MIKAALFDLDGTLLDTLGSIEYHLNNTLCERGITPLSTAEVRAFVGDGAAMLVSRALESRGIDIKKEAPTCEELTRIYVKSYNDAPYEKTEAYPGILDMVEELRRSGALLAVISNKPNDTVKQLIKSFFGEAFSVVLGAREGEPLKPSPKVPLDICRELAVEPFEVAYIGDTGVDMQTGAAMGAALNIGVTWGFRDTPELLACGATDIVSHPCEIAALCRKPG